MVCTKTVHWENPCIINPSFLCVLRESADSLSVQSWCIPSLDADQDPQRNDNIYFTFCEQPVLSGIKKNEKQTKCTKILLDPDPPPQYKKIDLDQHQNAWAGKTDYMVSLIGVIPLWSPM